VVQLEQFLRGPWTWQAMVDGMLVGDGTVVTMGGIFGLDGSQWAVSAGIERRVPLRQHVLARLGTAFADSNVALSGSLWEEWICIRADDRTIIFRQGPNTLFAVKTVRAILLAVQEDGVPGRCSLVIERLADFLIHMGY
jgi:hypothetical protein